MLDEFIYYVENKLGDVHIYSDREYAFDYYAQANGVKIWTKTKDLFPTINIIVDKPNVDINNIRKDNIVNETSVALRKAVAKYDKENTKQVKLKLNRTTDDAIIKKLEDVDNIQGYIKQLILKDIQQK